MSGSVRWASGARSPEAPSEPRPGTRRSRPRSSWAPPPAPPWQAGYGTANSGARRCGRVFADDADRRLQLVRVGVVDLVHQKVGGEEDRLREGIEDDWDDRVDQDRRRREPSPWHVRPREDGRHHEEHSEDRLRYAEVDG